MQSTKLSHLSIVAVVAVVGGWSLATLAMTSGWGMPLLPWGAAITLFVMAVIVLVLGLPIRRWNQGERDKPLDPIRAARVLVLAKASSLVGSVFLGWSLGLVVYILPLLSQPAWPDRIWQALGCGAAALVLIIVGLIVEYFCRIPPEDGDEEPAVPGNDSPQPV